MTEGVQIPFSANFHHVEKYADYIIWALYLKAASKHMAYTSFVSVGPTCMQGLFRAAPRSGYFSVMHACFVDLGQNLVLVGPDQHQCKSSRFGNYESEREKNTFILGFFSLRNRPTPEMVPPVPIPATNISTLPFVSSQISGPVVS